MSSPSDQEERKGGGEQGREQAKGQRMGGFSPLLSLLKLKLA